jgi:hypothetical protein
VTRLTRYQLRELAQVLVLANTPLSLFNGLVRCSAMDKLRKCPPKELVDYFDRITARPRRSEIVIALAYAVLSAILLRARDAARVPVDPTRLRWGRQICEHLSRAPVNTQEITITSPQPKPTILVESSPSANISGQLVGADGREIVWRNDND